MLNGENITNNNELTDELTDELNVELTEYKINNHTCTICMKDDLSEDEIYNTNCNHEFCKTCLDDWFKRGHQSCPLCRSLVETYKYKDEKYKLIIYEKNIPTNPSERNVMVNLSNPRFIRTLINTDPILRSIVLQNAKLRLMTFAASIGFMYMLNLCINVSSEYNELTDKYNMCMEDNKNITDILSGCINFSDMKGHYVSLYNGQNLVRCFYPNQLYYTCFK